MEDDETCNTRLSLGLGMGGYVPILEESQKVEEAINNHRKEEEEEFINFKIRIDERDEESDHNKSSRRKKLRLTKEQSAMLEDSFNLHTSLNPVQKQELSQQLNLKPRQIEVWFQNKRARSKLKQTEVDCEFWKKCCENLRDENRRLKKEVEELRGLNLKLGLPSTITSPLFNNNNNNIIEVSKVATLAICSSCKKPLKLKPFSINNNAIINDAKANIPGLLG